MATSLLCRRVIRPNYRGLITRVQGLSSHCHGPPVDGDPCKEKNKKSLVIGIYTDPDVIDDSGKFTPTAERYNRLVCNRLIELLRVSGPPPKLGEERIFYNLDQEFASVCLVGLGRECQGYDVFEQMDEGKEAIRIAAAVGSRNIQKLKAEKCYVESFGHAESAAEGAALGVWLYQEKKDRRHQKHIPQLELYDDCDWTGWQIGLQKAAAQNLSRQLMDTSANLMTPTSFAQNAVEVLCKSGVNVEVKVKGWAETQRMHAFLAAAQGSCEPPIFLELSYYGVSRDERPVVLIGKGITYNSGGLCFKKCFDQKKMRGDMSGAACVVAACRAVAGLQLPLNIRGLIPLCENMPGCAAMRCGDIVKAMNGKSIEIQTTDCAGRLALADALVYAQNFWPRFIVDIGTMTYDMRTALGCAASGVYSNSEALWEYMLAASMHTGDRVWRFPLWEHFTKLIVDHENCDVQTIGRGNCERCQGSLSCKVAAFLHEFVPCGDWLHLDTFGVMKANGYDEPYLRKGMSGRPTRTLVEFLSQLVCHRE
ncbi:cytosol aminopeptidase-like [Onthophagus taurus]|uniref:cytosol aminopeptidase-like n=1 Tax=Onthophagus taurus TaxID=166361 RepID=UPI000C206B3C|nr:cytosol aminopeptidase-like [Onthophagus taurus]